MSEDRTLHRLRAFLRLLAVALFAGTIVELILAGHTGEPLQLVPFILCGLGLLTLAAAWLRPSRRNVLALRVVMVIVACGSLLGVYEHFMGNLEFDRETHPGQSTSSLFVAALTGGDPLLAPGVLAVAAAVAVASTYSSGAPISEEPGAESTREVVSGRTRSGG
jgi:hypothetical protein